MQATHRGGLTGKARNIRHRNRVERIHAQQLLDEYLDPEEYEDRPRHVPVRGRADFLPTIDSWTQEDETFETGSQLELTLQEAPADGEWQSNEIVELQVESSEAPQAAMASVAVEKATTPAVKVIPAPYWARPRASFQPQGGRGVERNFDFKRFVYGCALGSAAAAAILLVVSTVFH